MTDDKEAVLRRVREFRAKEQDRLGNVAMANGLVAKARQYWRRADAIRQGELQENPHD